VLLVSATSGLGIDELASAVVARRQHTSANGSRADRRKAQARRWVEDRIRRRFGSEGVKAVDFERHMAATGGPFSAIDSITEMLRRRLALT
jgi:LAO/AO transport system kinase